MSKTARFIKHRGSWVSPLLAGQPEVRVATPVWAKAVNV
jgi:hypothetical protein